MITTILWVLFIVLILGISFLLAYSSMKDFHHIPTESKTEYGLYLIRQTESLTPALLNSLGKVIASSNVLFSLERLFKGNQAVLTIYAPKKILGEFSAKLNLLELEDYTVNLNSEDTMVWEMGLKSGLSINLEGDSIFKNLPLLQPEDQFFWQISLNANPDFSFQTQIRAVFYSADSIRKQTIASHLQDLSWAGLIKVPRPYSNQQMLEFYKLRTFSKDNQSPILSSEQLIVLMKV